MVDFAVSLDFTIPFPHQFQKFENDGNIEEVKNTEYPILKSLSSLDAKKSGAIIPSSPTNVSYFLSNQTELMIDAFFI